jgi:hypothetical protein
MDRKADRSADRNAKHGFGDDQGTRVGAPDQEEISPSEHSDTPPDRPARKTGMGGEAARGTKKSGELPDRAHRSGYGGNGGEPITSSHDRAPGK